MAVSREFRSGLETGVRVLPSVAVTLLQENILGTHRKRLYLLGIKAMLSYH